MSLESSHGVLETHETTNLVARLEQAMSAEATTRARTPVTAFKLRGGAASSRTTVRRSDRGCARRGDTLVDVWGRARRRRARWGRVGG